MAKRKRKFLDYPKDSPECKDVKFNNKKEFEEWLKEKTYAIINLIDAGQDIMTIHIDNGGEVLHTNLQSKIWNGKIVAIARLSPGKLLWWSDSAKMQDIRTKLVVDTIEMMEN